MKNYILLLAIFCNLFSLAQTPEDNLDKYWTYRDRLRQNFLKIGTLPGDCIPMSSRAIGLAYSGVPLNTNGNKPSRLFYQDATIYLGHYLAVLATEWKLLENRYNATSDFTEQASILTQSSQTKNELYYAIQTVNRLDLNAERYLSQSNSPPSSQDLNGLLMRDDVLENYHDNFQNDYSEIFQRECDFIRTHSNTAPLEVWGDAENNVAPGEQYSYGEGNVMSLDQVTTLLMGLVTIYKLVPSEIVQPSDSELPLNIHEEARTIALRIINYIINDVDGCTNNCKSFNIRNWDGLFRPAGYDLSFAAPFLVKIALELEDPDMLSM